MTKKEYKKDLAFKVLESPSDNTPYLHRNDGRAGYSSHSFTLDTHSIAILPNDDHNLSHKSMVDHDIAQRQGGRTRDRAHVAA